MVTRPSGPWYPINTRCDNEPGPPVPVIMPRLFMNGKALVTANRLFENKAPYRTIADVKDIRVEFKHDDER